MIKLYDYYKRNISDDNYYFFNFNNAIEEYFIFNNDYAVYDEKEAISRFKVLLYPANSYSESDCIEFILISFFLNNNGYYIELFPNFLERPTNVNKFSLDIRNYILAKDGRTNGTVTWAERKMTTNSMKFLKKENSIINISDNLNELFKTISNRNADYMSMSNDEKLAEINNVIENLLKEKDKWNSIDYQIEAFDFIKEEDVIKFRKLVHCFRHGSEDAVEERKEFTDRQKLFLINYGTTLCELIYSNIKKK